MQRLLLLASVLVISVFSTEVNSAPKVTEKTEYYDISGKTGAELFRSIMRKGPRHGFMSKAI
jgi:predicted secreted Zn-dependent protease